MLFTYVSGSSSSDYALGNIISNPVNVYGLAFYPLPTVAEVEPITKLLDTQRHKLYFDIRPLYGVPIFPSDPAPTGDDVTRKKEGFWFLEYEYKGNTNTAGDPLEYIKLQDANQPVTVFNESAVAPYKALTAVSTYNYIDWDLSDVQTDLAQRTRSERDNKVSSGYDYKGKDSKQEDIDITLNTDTSGLQMINNFYTQAVNGSQTISIFLASGKVTLTGDQMISLFDDLMSKIDQYYNDCETQVSSIKAATTIFDAQTAATWIYPAGPVPRT